MSPGAAVRLAVDERGTAWSLDEPLTEDPDRVVRQARRTARRGRDDLTDRGTEQRLADVDAGQRYAVGLATDQSAQGRGTRGSTASGRRLVPGREPEPDSV